MSSVMRFDEWQDSDGNPVFNGAGGVSPGGLVAVKSAIRDTPEVFSNVAGGANVAVGGLSITHAMADAGNKLIISAFLGAAGHSGGIGDIGVAVDDGAGLIAIGDSPGSRTAVTAGGRTAPSANVQIVTNPSVTFVHTPGDTASRTFTVRAINIQVGAQTLFINRSQDDTNTADRVRAVSSLVIQEVAV